MTWTITVPIEIPSQNTTNAWHWSMRHKHTGRCARLMQLAGAGQIPKATGKRTCHILAFRKQRCHDIANLVGGAKGFVDAMARLGLLVDDKDAMVVLSYDQSTLRHSPIKGKACTVVTIAEINLAS